MFSLNFENCKFSQKCAMLLDFEERSEKHDFAMFFWCVEWQERHPFIDKQVLKMLGKVWPLVNLTCLRGQGSHFCIKCKRNLPFNHG